MSGSLATFAACVLLFFGVAAGLAVVGDSSSPRKKFVVEHAEKRHEKHTC